MGACLIRASQRTRAVTLRFSAVTSSNQQGTQLERQPYRSLEVEQQPKKHRKAGRPKLLKGEAKGRIVPVRFRAEDMRRIGQSQAQQANRI